MRSEGSAHTLVTSTPKESRFRLVWWKVGLVAPSYAGTETVTAHLSSTQDREDFRWYDETGVRIP